MHLKALLAAAMAAAISNCAQAQEVHLYDGDSITIPDGWKITEPSQELPSQVLSTILIAGSKDGCGLRLDNAGAQKQEDFKATTAQYDDYLSQLLATAGLKAKSQGSSAETRVAGFRALSKDLALEIQGSEWGARVVQFNSKSRLYSAWVLAPSQAGADKCFEEGAKILGTFKSK